MFSRSTRCVDVVSAKRHVSVHSWMIETQVVTESGSMVLIVDVINNRGHLKSFLIGSLLMLMTCISLTIQ